MADWLPHSGMILPDFWGARIDYTNTDWSPWQPDKWIYHWPGSPPGGVTWDMAEPPYTRAKSDAALRAWEAFHLDVRGWLGIAYNYAIDMAGNVFMLRGEQRNGATSGDQEPDGVPEFWEGRAVLFMVNQDTTELTPEMGQAAAELWALDPGPVFGHRDISTTGTPCPGATVAQFIQEEGYKMGFQDDHGHPNIGDLRDTHKVDAVPEWAEDVWQAYVSAGGTSVPESGVWPFYRFDISWFWDRWVRPLEKRVADLEAIVAELDSSALAAKIDANTAAAQANAGAIDALEDFDQQIKDL